MYMYKSFISPIETVWIHLLEGTRRIRCHTKQEGGDDETVYLSIQYDYNPGFVSLKLVRWMSPGRQKVQNRQQSMLYRA